MELLIAIIILVISIVVGICTIVWLYEIRQNSFTQIEQNEQRQKILYSQLNLLAGIAEKSGVPLKDINEALAEFEIEYVD